MDAVRYITGTTWVSGGSDGSLALWSQTKKRPASVVRRAHGGEPDQAPSAGGLDGDAASWVQSVAVCHGADLVVSLCFGSSHVCCSMSSQGSWQGLRLGGLDVSREGHACMQASGAADGLIRLWAVEEGRAGAQVLRPVGGLPARGYVNGLHVARSGRFVLAGMGQEPRLGRWARDGAARNGLLLHRLSLEDPAEE